MHQPSGLPMTLERRLALAYLANLAGPTRPILERDVVALEAMLVMAKERGQAITEWACDVPTLPDVVLDAA